VFQLNFYHQLGEKPMLGGFSHSKCLPQLKINTLNFFLFMSHNMFSLLSAEE